MLDARSSSFGAGAAVQGSNSTYYPNAIYQNHQPPFIVDGKETAAPSPVVSQALNGEDRAEDPNPSPAAPRQCSVRGCLNPIEPPEPNAVTLKKMCAACRAKHRAYASTKRLRRKAEKTLVSRLSATAAGAHLEEAEAATSTWTNQEPAAPTVAQDSPPIPPTPSTSQSQPPVHWSHAIDPALFSQPSGSSSSSTLAGALTLPPSANNPSTHFSGGPSVAVDQAFSSSSSSASHFLDHSTNGGSSEHTHNVTQTQSQIQSETPGLPAIDPSASGAPESGGTTEAVPQALNGRPRFCSVKGCKAIILESMEDYPYKMCQPCRTRYRHYGITKRAKWKAEREAYDKELEGLRAKEDVRRAAAGLPPLGDSPDELRAWELSVIDEQVPLPTGHPREGVPMPMDPLDTRYSHQVPAEVPLPARMCTVSHCHKILPGFYRYKRCETHRIQNRWHSKLKRGREKYEKGFTLADGTPVVVPGPIRPKKSAEPKEKKPRKKMEANSKEVENTEGEGASGSGIVGENLEGGATPNKVAKKRSSKSSTVCREDECSNLIMPGTRWRTCDSCRGLKRTLRKEQRSTVERVRDDGIAFVNMTAAVDAPAGPSALVSASGSGSSTAIVPIDVDVSSRPAGAPAPYPPEYTSTSMLLTVNEPPPDKSESGGANQGVRLVRKYKKLPRYDKDASGPSTNAVASSSTAPALQPPQQPQQIPGSYPSAYPYPPPGAFRYYMPPGYYGMPPAAPGQPPLTYMPSPYPYAMVPPPHDKAGAPAPATPYPYYSYAIPPPGYEHYPRAQYSFPNSIPSHPPTAVGGLQTPYAVYKFRSTPQPPPGAPGGPSTADPSQGYSYYQYKSGLKNPPEEPPNKRRRMSNEVDGTPQDQTQRPPSPQVVETPGAAPASEPPADAPQPPEVAPQPVTIEVEAQNKETRTDASDVSPRVCGGKTCRRPLVSGTVGPLCEKCRTKMKKRQAITKQRFRLEPKKIVMAATSAVSLVSKNMEQ